MLLLYAIMEEFHNIQIPKNKQAWGFESFECREIRNFKLMLSVHVPSYIKAVKEDICTINDDLYRINDPSFSLETTFN